MKNQACSISADDRSAVLKATWALVKKTGLSFATALKRAWAAIKLKLALGQHVTSFQYKKEDGSERYAIGFNRIAPARTESEKPVKPADALLIKYFDLACDGWRSFRIDRLIID